MTSSDIPTRIRDFSFWLYQFELEGHLTAALECNINRHARNRDEQRKAYFFDPLVKLLGGTLAGKRVLDLGCNAGFWSLCALEAGCDFVVGIDAHIVNLAQAQFVFDVKGIAHDRYHFVHGNVLELDFQRLGEFDIVLCLNLLYHVHQPIKVLEKIAQVNRDILMIETMVSLRPGRMFELRREPRSTRPSTLLSADSDLVLVPTKQAVLEIVRYLDYKAAVLKPKFTSYRGAKGYKTGERRAFFCAKQTDLFNLSAETEAVSDAADIARLHVRYVRDVLGYVKQWTGRKWRAAALRRNGPAPDPFHEGKSR